MSVKKKFKNSCKSCNFETLENGDCLDPFWAKSSNFWVLFSGLSFRRCVEEKRSECAGDGCGKKRETEKLPLLLIVVDSVDSLVFCAFLGTHSCGAEILDFLFFMKSGTQRCFDVMYEQCIGFCAKRALGRHRSCSYCRERAESSHSKGFLKGKLQEKYAAACSRMQQHAAARSSMQQHAAA